MRVALLLLLLLPGSVLADVISFRGDFPDTTLRGKSYDLPDRYYGSAVRLRSAIYQKQLQADTHLRNCSPNSKSWREDAQRWNDLRAENWNMMKELRAILARAY
jgi:hypothetical protein